MTTSLAIRAVPVELWQCSNAHLLPSVAPDGPRTTSRCQDTDASPEAMPPYLHLCKDSLLLVMVTNYVTSGTPNTYQLTANSLLQADSHIECNESCAQLAGSLYPDA
jgi:hypothetical protein